MPFEFVCPHCHCKTKVLDRYAGQSGPCVECGKLVVMPHFNERGILVPTVVGPKTSPARTDRKKPTQITAIIGASVVTTLILITQGSDLDNMRTIAEALNSYCDRYGQYPPPVVTDSVGKPLYSWRVLVLPFMGYEDLYKEFELTQAWDSPSNMNLVRKMPSEYGSPNAKDAINSFETNYVILTGAGTLFPPSGSLSNANVDKHTILVVETNNNTIWSKPGDIDIGRGLRPGNRAMTDVGGLHKESFTAVTVEKELMRIPSNVPQAVLDALVTPNGGENVQTSTFID
jgi:Protein of unknown function (DUF1559)